MLSKLFTPLARLLKRFGACGVSGLIVGMLTGGLLAILDLIEGPLAPSVPEVLRLWLVCAVSGWLLLLALFVLLARWTLASVAGPALVNAGLASGLTILVCRALDAWGLGWWIGLLVGLLVGRLLCLLNNVLNRR
jgi:hypothetical protein